MPEGNMTPEDTQTVKDYMATLTAAVLPGPTPVPRPYDPLTPELIEWICSEQRPGGMQSPADLRRYAKRIKNTYLSWVQVESVINAFRIRLGELAAEGQPKIPFGELVAEGQPEIP